MANAIEIDETTGLPKLPADHFWEIERGRISIWKSADAQPWDEWRTWITYPGTDEAEARKEVADWVERELRYRPQYQIESEIFHTVTENKTRFRKVQRPYVNVRTRVRSPQVAHSKNFTMISSPVGEREPVNPDNVLELAELVYNSWQEEIEAEKLYGFYPPKSLNA